MANAVLNNYITKKSYNVDIITPQIVNSLYGVNIELFTKFRLNLLQQETDVKTAYKFMFAGTYPLLTEEERNAFSCDDCINLIDVEVLFKNIEEFQNVFNYILKSKDDIYKLSIYILNLSDKRALDVFELLPFEQCQFNLLEQLKQNEILSLYEKSEKLISVISIIEYMALTRTLNESLEQRLLDLFNETTPTYDLWDSYIKLLNELDEFTDTTLLILKKYKFENALPPKITEKLYEIKEYIGYIVGKSLYYKKFDYDSSIPINTYLIIYTDIAEVGALMQVNDEFIEQVYFNKNYEKFTKEQLLIYQGWDLNFELFKVVNETINNDVEFREFIMKSNKISSIEDNDLIADYLCQDKFINLLLNKEFRTKIMYLLWDDHYGKKGKLTKFVNKHRKIA